MKRESKYVNRVELLITLDYLFKHTDENHPATCPLICKYATKYGFIYDPNKKVGNEINRHRISDALTFLYNFCKTHKGIISFEIKMTDGGKYYATNRNYLSSSEAIAILESIDQNLALVEKEVLMDKIRKISFNQYECESFKQNKNSAISLRKYSNEYYAKVKLLKTALKENRLVHIRRRKHVFDEQLEKIVETNADSYYRVYKLKEYQNKLHTVLVNVDGTTLALPIERIELVDTILIEEFEELEDINKRLNNFYYNSMDELIEDNKILVGSANFATPFIFIFNKKYLDKIKESFEDYFSIEFHYTDRNVEVIKEEYPNTAFDNLNNDETVGFVKMKANNHAVLQWVRNDYFVAREITIISPSRINRQLAFNFSQLNDKYKKYGGRNND